MPAPPWVGVLNTTIPKYVRAVTQNTLRNRKFLAMAQSKGRVTFNWTGYWVDWPIQYAEAPIEGYADTQSITFPQRNYWKKAQLPWRGYVASDAMTYQQRLMNAGPEAIIDRYNSITKMLMQGMTQKLGDEIYVDGNASSNTKRFHGLESFFSTSGVSSRQPIGLPNDTYADLVCTLGNYGGTWTSTGGNTDWPKGTGDPEYDFWSPVVVNFTSTVAANLGGWTSATKTWPNTCREAIRYGIMVQQRNDMAQDNLDVALFNMELFRQFKDKVESNERVVVAKDEGLWKLGFRDVMNYDGVDISSEYGVPVDTGYGISFMNLELRSQQPELFKVHGPEEDITDLSIKFLISNFGNFYFNPRRMVKWAALG